MYIVMKHKGKANGNNKPLFKTGSYSAAWVYIHKHFGFKAEGIFVQYSLEAIAKANAAGLFPRPRPKYSLDLCGRCGCSLRLDKEIKRGLCGDCIEINTVAREFTEYTEVPGVRAE